MKIRKILEYARENNISDVHILENEKVYFRYLGELKETELFSTIDRRDFLSFLGETDCEKTDLEEIRLNKDFIFKDELNYRYRISFFISQSKFALVARIIKDKPDILENKFIAKLTNEKILNLKDGLILVTGATGSGKSTTLANIIKKFNEEKYYKILTLEDPIEFIFKNEKSLIIQREIGKDVPTYEEALKSSLRQDPDVVVIGEIRDSESLYAALKLSETGHLVLATLHTTNAVETINRIISMAASDKRDYIRQQLASVLRFILAQHLHIDKKNQKFIPIFEVLNNTKAVATLIAGDKLNQIQNLIESGTENYMITKEKYAKDLAILEDLI